MTWRARHPIGEAAIQRSVDVTYFYSADCPICDWYNQPIGVHEVGGRPPEAELVEHLQEQHPRSS